MTEDWTDWEKAIGFKLGSWYDSIPGTKPEGNYKFIYFQDDGQKKHGKELKKRFSKQFKLLIKSAPNYAKTGGFGEMRCAITLPDGKLFFALDYKGGNEEDTEALRREIIEAAQARNILTATIKDHVITTSDGKSYPLSECQIVFY